ncbi:helix-turn-helix domain-containing protein [Paenibacillaceae bacterium]|nr:helix-turn-helix domain-containing protein [Paenibacillaceae bacterium]
MVNQAAAVPELRSLLFQFSVVQKLHITAEWVSEEQCRDEYTLLIIAAGDCHLFVNEELITALEHSCYVLPPGSSWYISNLSSKEISLHFIAFIIIHTQLEQQVRFKEPLLPTNHSWIIYPFSRCSKLIEAMLSGGENTAGLEWFKQHLLFQELIGMLLEHNWPSDKSAGDMRSVEATARYIDSHYTKPITVKQLAALAGMPAWKYTSMFKDFTGKIPLDYLNQVRIDRSKEWLLASAAPLREIARKAGFTDEYYYSRRFRQFTGMTPRQYVHSMKQSLLVKDCTGHEVLIPSEPRRIIYYGETLGDLLILGAHPIGGNVHGLKNTWMQEELLRIVDIGIPFNREKAAGLEPDLIIYSNSDEEQYEQLVKIAPTLTYDPYGPLNKRLLMLGQWLGKQGEAERWLASYESKTMTMWQQLQDIIRPGETATVFVYHRGRRLFVMGTMGLPELLFHPSGFRPVPLVQQMIEAGEAYKEISEADITKYAGDRLFVMLPNTRQSRLATVELIHSNRWEGLPAVKNGQVYVLEEDQWNLTDAYTRDIQISKLPELLRIGYSKPTQSLQDEADR